FIQLDLRHAHVVQEIPGKGRGVVRHLNQPRQDGIGVDLKHPGHRTNAQPFTQRAHRPHQLLGRHALAVQRGAMGLLEVAATAGAMQLAPGATVGVTVGTDIAQPHPAPIGTGGLRAELRRRVHLARAATCGDDAGWWGAGRLWTRPSGLRTGLAVGRVDEARKGLRDPRALPGWWYALGWPRDACGVTPGPGSMQHAAQPEQTQEHELVEQEVGYHRVAPFHGGETGALYPFCRLLNYPHDRGTRPGSPVGLIPMVKPYTRLLMEGKEPTELERKILASL